jgi:hypothetical protein
MVASSSEVPALSLIIPVYNAADQLPATLIAVDAFATRYPHAPARVRAIPPQRTQSR